MAKDPFEPFYIPPEMRAFAEKSVTQARQAFDGFVEAANKAVGQIHGHAQAAQSGATEIAHKSIAYAEQNVAATFDFAQKLMNAKDAAEVFGAAVRICEPANAGPFEPGARPRTKRRQDCGRCC